MKSRDERCEWPASIEVVFVYTELMNWGIVLPDVVSFEVSNQVD